MPSLHPKKLLNCPAPAKINWFLHVVEREPNDGYHHLQSAFQMINWCDELDFVLRDDGQIIRHGGLPIDPASDLCVRAAQLLQKTHGSSFGVDITLRKYIPVGAGLGGGSSDAATTLIALNELWGIHASQAELMELALPLGADVPFFIFGQTGFGEKRGEVLQNIDVPTCKLLIVYPAQEVPTAKIFAHSALTRDTKKCTITDFTAVVEMYGGFVIPSEGSGFEKKSFFWGKNDLEPIAVGMFPVIAQALDWVGQMTQMPARMSGSGSSVFSPIRSDIGQPLDFITAIEKQCPQSQWQVAVVETLSEHPMLAWQSQL